MKLSMFSWLACALLLAALLVFIGPKRFLTPPVGSTGEPLIGGRFELTDGQGNKRTDNDFRGKFTLIYFGFTHCPDICPTTLLVIKNALERVGQEKSAQIQPLFITLDPERDTHEVVGRYVRNFGDTLIGLTGTPAQIRQVADAYHVFFSKSPQPDSAAGYLIDHSGFIYLMDKRGKYIAHFAHTIPEGELASKLNQFVQ